MKSLIIGIVFIFAGILFSGSGLYLLSEKYLNALVDAASLIDEKKRNKTRFLGKASGYFAFGFGSFTIIWGILIMCFSPIKEILIMCYLFILLLVSVCLSIFIKIKK